MGNNAFGILISDWQVLFREGIHFAVSSEENIVVIGETIYNSEIIKLVDSLKPALVIANIKEDELSGFKLLHHIKHTYPCISVILTVDSFNAEDVFHIIQGGANGCLCKDDTLEYVASVVRRAASGLFPVETLLLHQNIATLILREFDFVLQQPKIVSSFMKPLNPAELEILGYAIEGKCQYSDAISGEIENIRSKLVENRHNYELIKTAQAQLIALEHPEGSGLYVSREEFTKLRNNIKDLLHTSNG